ncbi:Protein of unknown function [Gryllus bimaculatus]|nr:Protein of unknown function [Gryllus bimaculatus]
MTKQRRETLGSVHKQPSSTASWAFLRGDDHAFLRGDTSGGQCSAAEPHSLALQSIHYYLKNKHIQFLHMDKIFRKSEVHPQEFATTRGERNCANRRSNARGLRAPQPVRSPGCSRVQTLPRFSGAEAGAGAEEEVGAGRPGRQASAARRGGGPAPTGRLIAGRAAQNPTPLSPSGGRVCFSRPSARAARSMSKLSVEPEPFKHLAD